MNKRAKEENRMLAEGNSLRIMGVFFSVFGLILWVAMAFTDDVRGQVTDFATGLSLGVIGVLMYIRGVRLLDPASGGR